MKEWRKEFEVKIKEYKWKINYEYDTKKGVYQGRGENGKPDGFGVLIQDDWRAEAEWRNGRYHGPVYKEKKNQWWRYFLCDNGKVEGKHLHYFMDGRRNEYEYEGG